MHETPLVIYHAGCWDGFCAAWVARRALGDIEAVPAHYGTEPPDVTGRMVYVLDFCYPRATMRRMASQVSRLVVLDHHKTARGALDGFVDEVISSVDYLAEPKAQPVIVFDMEKSGGRITWEYFNPPVDGVPVRSPWLVDYTEDRDLWRHLLPESENINAALRSHPLDFALWDEFNDSVGQREMFKREGAAIRRRERQIVEEHIRHAREIEMAGHRVLAVNATVLFSEIAGELAKGRPFGACYFDRFDGKRQWSLRSDADGVDVSAIAKAHGGGGHVRASGFEEAPPVLATQGSLLFSLVRQRS